MYAKQKTLALLPRTCRLPAIIRSVAWKSLQRLPIRATPDGLVTLETSFSQARKLGERSISEWLDHLERNIEVLESAVGEGVYKD